MAVRLGARIAVGPHELDDFPEGFALANSCIANPVVGVLVAVAIAVHNIPEEFAMAIPAAALRRRRFLLGAAVVSALAEPIGALIGAQRRRALPLPQRRVPLVRPPGR